LFGPDGDTANALVPPHGSQRRTGLPRGLTAEKGVVSYGHRQADRGQPGERQEVHGADIAGGKARSSGNALKHGLLSRDLLFRGECPDEFEAFREAVIGQLAPRGGLEELLAERVVASAWRRRRVLQVERELLQGWSPGKLDGSEPSVAFMAMNTGGHMVDRLARYEVHLERAEYKALHERQRWQAARQGQAAPLTLSPSRS